MLQIIILKAGNCSRETRKNKPNNQDKTRWRLLAVTHSRNFYCAGWQGGIFKAVFISYLSLARVCFSLGLISLKDPGPRGLY